MIKDLIKKILVPLDGSKNSFRGLDEAIYLARQCGATLTGLYVIPFYPRGLTLFPLPHVRELSERAKKIMAYAKKRAAQNGIVFNEKITDGHEPDEIIDFAKEKKFDLIVIGARGHGAAKRFFLGSVSNTVVHGSKTPVLVVKL